MVAAPSCTHNLRFLYRWFRTGIPWKGDSHTLLWRKEKPANLDTYWPGPVILPQTPTWLTSLPPSGRLSKYPHTAAQESNCLIWGWSIWVYSESCWQIVNYSQTINMIQEFEGNRTKDKNIRICAYLLLG